MEEIQEIKLDYSVKNNIDGYLAVFGVRVDDFDFYTNPLLIKDSSGKRLSLSSEALKDIHHIARILLSRNRSMMTSKTMVRLVFKKIALNKYNVILGDLDLVGDRDVNIEIALGLFTDILNVNIEYNTDLPWMASVIQDNKVQCGFVSSNWNECLDRLHELELITGEVKVNMEEAKKDKQVVITKYDSTVYLLELNNYSLDQIQSLKY